MDLVYKPYILPIWWLYATYPFTRTWKIQWLNHESPRFVLVLNDGNQRVIRVSLHVLWNRTLIFHLECCCFQTPELVSLTHPCGLLLNRQTTPWIIQVGDNDLPTLRIDHGCLVKDIYMWKQWSGDQRLSCLFFLYLCDSNIHVTYVTNYSCSHDDAFSFSTWCGIESQSHAATKRRAAKGRAFMWRCPFHAMKCRDLAHTSTRICVKITDITWILSSWGLKNVYPGGPKNKWVTGAIAPYLRRGPITPVHLLQDWEIWFNFDFNLSPVFLFDRKTPTKQGG